MGLGEGGWEGGLGGGVPPVHISTETASDIQREPIY